MKLHAVNGLFPVAQAHDFPLLGFGGDFQAVWDGLSLHDERMIARGLKGILQAGKDALSVVVDHRGFAMHEPVGPNNISAEDFAHALMPQAHPEQGSVAAEFFNDRATNARLFRRAGAGGNANALGAKRCDFPHGDFVIAANEHFCAQLAEVLHEVVSEGVVVVDDQQHGSLGREIGAKSIYISTRRYGNGEFNLR